MSPAARGSGFLWDRKGYVVTNFHVIQSASSAQVVLADRSMWDARLVGGEPDKDIAVLKIDAPEDRLPPILVGTSHDLQVGQKVFAIGKPVRPRPNAHQRHHQRLGSRDSVGHPASHSGRDPDETRPSTPATRGDRCSTAPVA